METVPTKKPRGKPGAPRHQAIRWTVNMAAREFGVHREQLERQRRALGIEAGADGCFTSRDVGRILFGDLAGEKLRKLRAEADLAEIEVQTARKERVPLEVISAVHEHSFRLEAAIIRRSKLPEADKIEIFAEMRSLAERVLREGFKLPPLSAEAEAATGQ